MLYPETIEVLAAQESVTWCDPPVSATVIGELVALLVIVTLPVELPVDVGVRLTDNTADCPAIRTVVGATPLALYPAPETVTCDTVTLEFPTFVKVTFCKLVLPTATLPKLTLEGVAVKTRAADVPVPVSGIDSGDALLVKLMLPLTTPVAVGANTALNVVLPPGVIVTGRLSPATLSPVPDALA
jgi:hypothetical protein